jgi:tetratricopeptide (TPR) repeat protein
VLVTSNTHAWRGAAEPVEIRLWPKEIGADYLIVRTGRMAERGAAESLSEALGGLPLAHEQAAAYCERLDMSFSDYQQRFEAAPANFLDDNLACLLRDTGRPSEAEPLFQRAIDIGEKILGADHPDVATRWSNLACMLRDSGRASDAEPLFRRAIAVGDKALGAEHPLTQRYQSHYARVLLITDRTADALQLGQAALSTHERINGPNHPWTKDSARVTADALAALGRAAEAAALREKYGIAGEGGKKE